MPPVAKGYRFTREGRTIDVATAGYLDAGRVARVIAIDADGAYWLLEIGGQGQLMKTIVGPVTIESALEMAEAVLAGKDHGAVALATTTLALAVAARVIREAA